MNSSEFSKICKDLYVISETLNIEVTKGKINFNVEADVGKGTIEIQHLEKEASEESTMIDMTDPVKLSFALRYINQFNKAASLSPKVIIYLSNDSPLVIEYTS